MRVLHVQKVKGIGGSERHLLSLLPALEERDVEVHLLVLAEGDAGAFVTQAESSGIATTTINAGPDLNPTLVPSLYAHIRRLQPDIVHTHLIHADVHGQPAAKLARVPGVSSMHGTPAFYLGGRHRAAGRQVGRLANRRIAISEHVAQFIRANRLAPPERIRTVPYGIALGGWSLTSDERDALRRREGFGERDVIVGIAARLIPGKGHVELIDSFERAAEGRPDLVLMIAGEGPERPAIERRVERSKHGDRIRVVGHVDNVTRLMNTCNIVVAPTRPELSEGFGLSVLEAMATGRPVVATDVGSLPEIVVDGATGIIVDPAKPQALADALGALADNPVLRARYGAAGAARAQAEYGLDAMVDRTIAVYREVT